MPHETSLCSYKRAWKANFGSPLQSGGKTFWRRENCGPSSETFLLTKTLTGRQQVYQTCRLALPAYPFPSHPSRSKAQS
jgi:hypothetical protein